MYDITHLWVRNFLSLKFIIFKNVYNVVLWPFLQIVPFMIDIERISGRCKFLSFIALLVFATAIGSALFGKNSHSIEKLWTICTINKWSRGLCFFALFNQVISIINDTITIYYCSNYINYYSLHTHLLNLQLKKLLRFVFKYW